MSRTWNLHLLTGQTELMTLLLNESNKWIKQAKESNQSTGLLNIVKIFNSYKNTTDIKQKSILSSNESTTTTPTTMISPSIITTIIIIAFTTTTNTHTTHFTNIINSSINSVTTTTTTTTMTKTLPTYSNSHPSIGLLSTTCL
ncbi:unnamed protein product [Schistosoma margrebowiei]|uniref:Uncharacterized protein n=1 Tax=Schistosoma margrebowiei TaxID=48269 RepID=A0A183N172_9TREM|nr:unnamed protein product [Schistosoma margrebowiei]